MNKPLCHDLECQNILDCVQDIYQTVNDQSHWQAVLQHFSKMVKGGKGVMISKNNETGHIDTLDAYNTKAYGFSYRDLGRYFNGAYLIDEWTQFEETCGLGELCVFNDHLSLKDLKKTDYYKQWLKPQEVTAGMAVQIFKVKKFRIVFYIVYDDDSEYVDYLQNSLEQLSPHLCQAMSLYMSSIGIEEDSSSTGRAEYLMKRYKLTKRELEVTSALIRASTVQLAANSLYISESTVKTHVKSIKKKMGVRTSHEMMLRLFSLTD